MVDEFVIMIRIVKHCIVLTYYLVQITCALCTACTVHTFDGWYLEHTSRHVWGDSYNIFGKHNQRGEYRTSGI